MAPGEIQRHAADGQGRTGPAPGGLSAPALLVVVALTAAVMAQGVFYQPIQLIVGGVLAAAVRSSAAGAVGRRAAGGRRRRFAGRLGGGERRPGRRRPQGHRPRLPPGRDGSGLDDRKPRRGRGAGDARRRRHRSRRPPGTGGLARRGVAGPPTGTGRPGPVARGGDHHQCERPRRPAGPARPHRPGQSRPAARSPSAPAWPACCWPAWAPPSVGAALIAFAAGAVVLCRALGWRRLVSAATGPLLGAVLALAALTRAVATSGSARPVLAVGGFALGAVLAGRAEVHAVRPAVRLVLIAVVGAGLVAAMGAAGRLTLSSPDRAGEAGAALRLAAGRPIVAVGSGWQSFEWTDAEVPVSRRVRPQRVPAGARRTGRGGPRTPDRPVGRGRLRRLARPTDDQEQRDLGGCGWRSGCRCHPCRVRLRLVRASRPAGRRPAGRHRHASREQGGST